MSNWSVVIMGIALVISIASPVLTSLINNVFQLILKDREVFVQRRLDVIENYIKYASVCSYALGVPDEFAKYKTTIFLYAPKGIWEKIIVLNKRLEGDRFSDEVAGLLYEVTDGLRDVYKESKRRVK